MSAKTDAPTEREIDALANGETNAPTVGENGRPADGRIHSGESVQTKKEPPTCADGSWSFMAPRVGFEPTTLRLTAGCSAVELPRNFFGALRFLGARKYYRHFNCRRNPLFQKFFQQPIPGAALDLQVHPNASIPLSNSAGHARLGRTRNGTEAFRRIMAENASFPNGRGWFRVKDAAGTTMCIVYYGIVCVRYNHEKRSLSNFRKTRISRRDSGETFLNSRNEPQIFHARRQLATRSSKSRMHSTAGRSRRSSARAIRT